ncbi:MULTISPECIES: ABC transporter permease [Pseudochrobactrum]|jgi:peptide/nickel transport system permease protein|uniref:Peptide/nickel transport system permease protein n=2 Tax=Pseudochrobactrum TaxID=354349 RepID=A0A366DPU0_9HYPH|nr:MULTISPECIES: ABC transporter permease [Pseudochrobactrum]MBX8803036.1 ABC transporter permease [Ochrobactrum sp. MR28]MBX8817072.1 ABC transporter permease [Ochrobactrum sp. MR31]MDR2311920.1 ABC transporter permease [Brucellaceae bacterium]MDM7850722.1 ABC transporter permease [Pseudochrobactrum kiredjianiae]RBO92110.1 peptide/nickel transport system permease protein [Pseudochrobactrum asaccharolyticum]
MTAFIIRRLFQALLVLFVTSVIVFAGVYAIGDPLEILLPADATMAERLQVTQALGLDKPLIVQYWHFLANALQGDLGTSFVYNQPSISVILQRLPATLELAFCALVLAIVIGIPLGLLSGLKAGSATDETIMTGSILGFSLPNFWQGMMLIMIFSVYLGWLPSTGRGQTGTILGIETSLATWNGIQHLILPAINLSLAKISLVIRLTRTGVQETMPLDFVKFARARGLAPSRVIFVHVLKNILIPIITVIGIEFGSLIAFAVVTETIFAWPGVGKLIIDSINILDRPIVVAYILVVVSMFIVINLVVDVLYSLLDPRIRSKR